MKKDRISSSSSDEKSITRKMNKSKTSLSIVESTEQIIIDPEALK
jgi:hypothetical protein